MGNHLKDNGLNVYLWDYQSRKGTIEQHANDLVEMLQIIAKNRPGEPIHFVSHSVGGVIVRTAVNHPDCPAEAKIGKAILLGPPNKGSALARRFQRCPLANWIFGEKTGRQLLYFKEEDIQRLGLFPESMQLLVVAGQHGSPFTSRWMREPNDGKVTIEETKLATPHKHCVLDVSHTWIMTSRQCISIATKFLLAD